MTYPAGAQEPVLEPLPPRFVCRLNLQEFSVLNSAALGAVARFGGEVDFEVQMSRSARGEVEWAITIRNPRLIRAWSRWVAEKSLELVRTLDADLPSAEDRLALKTIQTLSAKLEEAEARPVWDTVRVAGRWTDSTGGYALVTNTGRLGLTGMATTKLPALGTHDVVVAGFLKVAGEIDAIHVAPRKLNTLEVITMSACPYGQASLKKILPALQNQESQEAPRLHVGYIFYREPDTSGAYSALHGEAELMENLVQICVRDGHPEAFHRYLATRLNHADSSWQWVALEAGLAPAEADAISRRIESDRIRLLDAEFGYVAQVLGVADGSPTYLWEGERIHSLEVVPALESVLAPSERCSRDH